MLLAGPAVARIAPDVAAVVEPEARLPVTARDVTRVLRGLNKGRVQQNAVSAFFIECCGRKIIFACLTAP